MTHGFIAPWLGGGGTDAREGAGGLAREVRPPADTDRWPFWVKGYVQEQRHAEELVPRFHTRSRHVARAYPDAYFPSRDKSEDGLMALSHEVFAQAALKRRQKGKHPGTTPFEVYVARAFNGPVIRDWTFYNRRSITRQVLRTHHEKNLRHCPRLRWQTELSLRVLRALQDLAVETKVPKAPSLWTLRAPALAARLDPNTLRRRLREHPDKAVPSLVTLALRHLGAASHALLIDLIGEALGGGPEENTDALPAAPAPEPSALRGPLLDALGRLSPQDTELLVLVGQGLKYGEVTRRCPRYKNSDQLAQSVKAINAVFLEVLTGQSPPPATDMGPQALMRCVFAALLEALPTLATEIEA